MYFSKSGLETTRRLRSQGGKNDNVSTKIGPPVGVAKVSWLIVFVALSSPVIIGFKVQTAPGC